MSSGPPPPPPPPRPAAGGRAGAPAPVSVFGKRPPGGPGAPSPFAGAKADPAARRANLMSVYSQYANPMAGAAPAAATTAAAASPPPPPPPPSSGAKTVPGAAVSGPPPPAQAAFGSPPAPSNRGTAPPPPPPPPPASASSAKPPSLPKMGALAAPSSGPPPPPLPKGSAGGRLTSGGPRYAVPDFAFNETPDRADAARRQSENDAVPTSTSEASPTTSTAPTTALRAPLPAGTPPTLYNSPILSAGTQPPPPPSQPPVPMTSSPNLPTTTAPPPPLTTRVSGAGMRGPGSSRASSNGAGSRTSSRHSQREGRTAFLDKEKDLPDLPQTTQAKNPSSMFIFQQDGATPTTTTTAAAAAAAAPGAPQFSSSRPSSRSGSLHAHTAATAAIATGGRHGAPPTTTTNTKSPNATAGLLHRDIPSFLKPGGGGSGGSASSAPRGRLASGSSAGSAGTHAPSSRGRELLEAALMSRGNRSAHVRSANASQSAAPTPEDSSTTLLPTKEKTEEDVEKPPVQLPAAENKTGAAGNPFEAPENAGYGAAGKGVVTQQEEGEDEGDQDTFVLHRRSSTGDYSAASQSYRGADGSSRTSPVMRVPPLQRGPPPPASSNTTSASTAPTADARFPAQSIPPRSAAAAAVAGDRLPNQQSQCASLPPPQQQSSRHVNSIVPLSSRELASSGLIAGEVDVAALEVRDITNRHTPRSGAMEPLPTPTDEEAQPRHPSESLRRTTESLPLPHAAEQDEVTYELPAAEAKPNPFLDASMDDEGDAAFGSDAPLAAAAPPPPPPLPHHAPYTGATVTSTPPPLDVHGGAAAGAHASTVNPFANAAPWGNGARGTLPVPPPPMQHPQHPQQLPVQPPPLPSPRFQQQQQQQQRPPIAPGAAATNGTNGNNTGFTTPRSGATTAAGAGNGRDPATQPRNPQPPVTSSSALRGPYAASPYTRDADNSHTLDEESPMPLRPPSFDSVPQPDGFGEEEENAEMPDMQMPVVEDEVEDGASFNDAFTQGERRAMGDEETGTAAAATTAIPAAGAAPEADNRQFSSVFGESDEASLRDAEAAAADERARARRDTQQPSDLVVHTTVNAEAASSSPPPSQHVPPLDHNRGSANPFAHRQAAAATRRDSSDALRKQHQEQLQARVHAAQQVSATGGTALPPPPPPPISRDAPHNSPHAEEPSKHLYDFASPQGTPFSGDRFGGNHHDSRSSTTNGQQPPLNSSSNLFAAAAQPQSLDFGADGSSPVDAKASGVLPRPSFASASNPFLDADEDVFGAPNTRNAGPAAAAAAGAKPAPQHGATASISSLPPQQTSPNAFSTSLEAVGGGGSSSAAKSAQPLSMASSVGGGQALGFGDDDGTASSGIGTFLSTNNNVNNSSSNGNGNAAACATPGGSALVNPFSKAARAAALAVSTDVATSNVSPGASLTSSFAGRRKPVRRLGAPCFAIFVGGATTGVPLTEISKGVSCIAACFNHPRAPSPTMGGGMHGAANNNNNNAARTRSSSTQAAPGSNPMSQASSFRVPSTNGLSRTTPKPAGAALDAANLSGAAHGGQSTSSSCLSFCSVTTALVSKGSVVDRKGIRGTEAGRRYVRALQNAVFPCAVNASTWADVADAVEALETCVPAPLGSVLAIILKDAFAEETAEGFVWKENGGRRLGELLLQSAQAEARRYATMATSGHGGATLAAATTASPMNMAAPNAAAMDSKEKAAALVKLEDLLCTGQRVEAVEVALEARLYAHALLISMMCPTKDEYLRSVQAVMQKELLLHSPLAHAYGMFNELPLPPLLPPQQPNSPKADGDSDGAADKSEEAAAAQDQRRQRENALREQATLRGTWRRHAAVLLANFTRHSGEGLLALAGNLQQVHLVVEAHTCLLLLHLTPLGMAAPVRAGAEPLPPVASLTDEDVEDILPRPDQRQTMEEIRRRLGVVGGMYHPTQGCRTGFLSPVTTLLTQLLHLAHDRLDARAPPLALPGVQGPPVSFHGLPRCPPRTDVGYRMMQVLWLREIGLVRESRQALNALLQRMPPPAAFSLRAPPRTLNELVYLFGAVPAPGQAGEGMRQSPQPPSTSESASATQQPSGSASTAVAPHSVDEAALDGGEEAQENAAEDNDTAERAHGSSPPPSLPASPQENHMPHHSSPAHPLPPPPPPPPAQQMPPKQGPPPPQQGLRGSALPAPHAPPTAGPGLTPAQRAAALQPPARPSAPAAQNSHAPPSPPQQQQQQQQPQQAPAASSPPPPPPASQTSAPDNAGAKPAPKPAAKPAAKPASRRSRSMEALRNLFFRRGKSEADGAEKQPAAEEAKPMHLDTEKPPAFDPVTGRWLFPETEEEKKLRELAKQGPPKMAPRASADPAPAPAPTAPSAGGSPAPQQQPLSSPPAAPAGPAAGAGAAPPAPTSVGGAARRPPGASGGHPAPLHGAAAPVFVPGRGAPPPMMAGRGVGGVRRPPGRQQYVDMFNNTN